MPEGRAVAAVLCALALWTGVAAAQERKGSDKPESSPPAGREHFQLKLGAGYDQGDFGTADADKGLGTGEWDVGIGVEWDKRFREFFLLGDVSYTFIGEPPHQDFRNRPAFSIGIGRQFTSEIAGTVMLDWRRAIVAKGDD